MKKTLMLAIFAIICIAVWAQEQNNVKTRVISQTLFFPLPKATVDKKSGLSTIKWPSIENNESHENIGIVSNVPVVKDVESIYGKNDMQGDYVPVQWSLTDEGDNTILHCYLLMTSDIVTNLWLGSPHSAILDKETGIIYQARTTVPEKCFDKVFNVKGKKGTAFDLQVVFPKLPESAKKLAIYGVPNWYLSGRDIQDVAFTTSDSAPEYDPIPDIHLATMVKDENNYDVNNDETWAVYENPHTILPVEENTMALWRTPDATYLALSTEQNWLREYYGRGGNTVLLDNHGHQYKCKGVMGYPNNKLFYVDGCSGDYFAIVLIFEPLPLRVENVTYIVPEGEPFEVWGANWSGNVIPNLEVSQLRKNQKLFEYHPRVVVK